jgi:arylsulfatase A-like enzyme
MMRQAFAARFFPLVFGLAMSSSVGRGAEADRPNIVVLVADDLGFSDVGFQGVKDIPTPHLDALARGGVRCTNGYVSGPYCSPTRAGLLTGRYQQRFGHEFNPGGEAGTGNLGLPVSETTLVERFRASGYRTGLVGKWHLGGAPRFHPQKRGFDEFFGFLGGGHTYFAARSRNILRGADVVAEPTYLTDAFGREAVAFIEKHKGHPFFLEVAFNAVHTPMDATDERLGRFTSIPDKTRRTYAAMLSALDDAVGAVLAKLRDSNLEEKTLIFFLSDNGGPTMLGTTINGSSNAPLRGSKRTTLEGGIHVPFVVSWKGKLPAGRVYGRPVIQLDILPTALAAAGIAIDPAWKLDGVDLLPFLTAESKTEIPHESLYWRFGRQDAIRRGDWKLVRYDEAVDTGRRSRAAEIAVTPRRLYNLASDPGESRDLAAENPRKVEELLGDWEAWDRQLVPPRWGPDGQASTSAR